MSEIEYEKRMEGYLRDGNESGEMELKVARWDWNWWDGIENAEMVGGRMPGKQNKGGAGKE